MMFDVSLVKKRYFELKCPDNGKVLHIEPPKLKTLRKLESMNDKTTVYDMADNLSKIISKNRENRRVSTDALLDWMDFDQLLEFVRAYMEWIYEEKSTNPN